MEEIFAPIDLFLQLEESIQQSLSSWRTAWNIYVNRNNPVTPPNHWVRVVVISSTVSTTSHWNDPSRFRHLVINPARIFPRHIPIKFQGNNNVGTWNFTGKGRQKNDPKIKLIMFHEDQWQKNPNQVRMRHYNRRNSQHYDLCSSRL